jgi:hypothetical protein
MVIIASYLDVMGAIDCLVEEGSVFFKAANSTFGAVA